MKIFGNRMIVLLFTMLFVTVMSNAQTPMGNQERSSRKDIYPHKEISKSQTVNDNLQVVKSSELNYSEGIQNDEVEMNGKDKPSVPFSKSKDVLLDEGFETWEPVDWNFYMIGIEWVGWQQSSYLPNSGDYSASHAYYAGGIHDNWMVTPQLSIDDVYKLKFYSKITDIDYYDYSGVLISTGSGDPEDDEFIEIFNADDAIEDSWTEYIIDLSDYMDEDIYIAFQYTGNEAHKWYIDDVKVVPLNYIDGGITSVTNPALGTTTVGGNIEDVTVELTNFGSDTITDVSVDWIINDEEQLTFEVEGLALSPQETIELLIGEFDFAEYGDYEISIFCTIADDENPGNDTLIGVYTVDDFGDVGITAISPNGSMAAAIEQDVAVTIHNYGVNVLESVEIEWEVNGVPQDSFVASNLNISSGSSTEKIIGEFDFSIVDNYEIFANTNLPADYNPSNDTLTIGFASGLLLESFEGPHAQFWPPDHWESKYATYLMDWPYDGNYMGMILSGSNEWGSSDGWLTTPLLDISAGDEISFQLRQDGLTGSGFSVNWLNEETGEINLIENISVTVGSWYSQTVDISDAAGINRIVFKVSSTSYADAYLDRIESTAPVYTFSDDMEVLLFKHDWTPLANVEDTISCKVRNYTPSNVSAGDYTVKLMEDPGVELSSISGLAIDAMEILEYEFYYTFVDENQHNLYIEVDYDNDQNTVDNISNIVSVYPVPETTNNVLVGNAEQSSLSIPFDTFGTEGWGQDDFTQIIYHFDEIGSMGYIYGLKFHYSLYALMYGQELPLKVWIGETENTNLSAGWEPYENLSLVFDSLVITKNYENEMFIPFSEPYLYTGGNLVIQTIQYDPEFMASWTHFATTSTPGEIRTAKSPDWYEIDPENPPSFEFETQKWEQIPDATFILDPFEDLIDVVGTVYDENNDPMENVLVKLDETAIITYTDEEGNYVLPNIPYGEWTILAIALGYEDNYTTSEIGEDDYEFDIYMDPKPLLSLSGYVEGTGQSGEPVENVKINISGYNDYFEQTDSDGIFNIESVYGNTDYRLEVSKFGFESFDTTFSVAEINIDFGTIILQERIISTFNVISDEEQDDISANIYWPDPQSGMEDTLMFDTGSELYGLANDPDEHVWLGNFFPNDEVITITDVTVFFINNPQESGEVSLDIFDMDENLLVSSEKFFTQNDTYLTIDFPNLTYDGSLFIMLHWKNNPATTHMLGIDFTPSLPDLCYIGFPNEDFQLLSSFLGTSPGVALIRANVLKEAEEKSSEEKAVESYNLYRGLSDDFYNIDEWTLVNSEPVSELEFMDESWLYTEPNKYRYAIEAIYAEGIAEVSYSNILSVDFVSPSNLSIDVDAESGGTLFSWDSPEHNVQSFDVYLDDFDTPVTTGVSDLEYVFEDLSTGTYEVGVKAVYNNGESEIESLIFTLTGVNDYDENQVQIYPNPASDIVNIERADGSIVVITDVTGRIIDRFDCGRINYQLNVSDYEIGIYFVQLIKDKNITTVKLNISR